MPKVNKRTGRKRIVVEEAQRKRLLQIMESIYKKNPTANKVTSTSGFWINVATELNELGPKKEGVRWRKQWTDTLLRLRKRINERKELLNVAEIQDATVSTDLKLSADDNIILNMYGGATGFLSRSRKHVRRIRNGRIETICIEDSDSEMTDFNGEERINTNNDDKRLEYDNGTNNYKELTYPDPHQMSVLPERDSNNYGNYDKDGNLVDNPVECDINEVDPYTESLQIQRQTLLGIRKLEIAQQETNTLLKFLIEKLTEQTFDNADNQHMEYTNQSVVCNLKSENIDDNYNGQR